MPIPGYQDFMLPLLRVAPDGADHTVSATMELLAKQLSISYEDRDILLPSGTQTRIYDRVTQRGLSGGRKNAPLRVAAKRAL
jgi:restriction system protein